MLSDFLYHNPTLPEYSGSVGIIVLPEIFGMNQGITDVVDRLQETFALPAFGLDFFYALTGKSNILDPVSDRDYGISLMGDMSHSLFTDIFGQAKKVIAQHYPTITHFTVVGFCFGGKLAYLSATDLSVNRVISFYGGSSTKPYVDGDSVIDVVARVRKSDDSLRILGIFGDQDSSISEEDRDIIHDRFADADIDYTELVYPAGHAFFNHLRDTHMPEASQQAWRDLLLWINGH